MNPKHRPLLALLVLVFVSLACIPGTKKVVGEVTCVDQGYTFPYGTQYKCSCPMDGKTYPAGQLSAAQLSSYNPTSLKTVVCTDYYAGQSINQDPAPTEPPTEEPTEEPAATEPPVESAPLTPLLKGSVSACDTAQGYINFPLAESNPDIVGKTLGVTINGKAVNCGIPAVNTSVLACPLPPGTVFPITVSVTLAGVEVNNFSNDGYFCTNTSNNTGSEDTTEEEPVAPLSCIPNLIDPYSCAP